MQYTSTPHTPNQDPKLYFPHSALLETKRPPKNLSAVVSVKQSPNNSFLDYNQSTTPTDNSFYLPQSFGNFVPISINSRHMGLIKPKPKKKKTALDPIRFFYPVKLKEKEPIQKPKPLKLISHDSMRQPVTSDLRSIAPIKQRIESIIENQNVCMNMRKRLPGIEPQNYTFDFSKQTPRKIGMEEYLEKINENPLPKPKQPRNKNVSFDQYSQQYSQLGSSDSQRSALNLDSSRLDAVLPPIRNNSPIKPAVQLPTIRLKNPPQIIRKRRDYSVDDRSDLGTVREEVEVKQRPQQSFIEKRIFTFENAEEQLSSRESHATKAKRFLKEGKELEVSIHKDIDEYREKLLQKLKRERISRNPSSPSQRWGD